MKSLRKTIRSIILETCNRGSYFGPAGSGVIVLCTEDDTILLQKRSMRVSGGAGQWAFPGGGYHPSGEERHYRTPILKGFQVDPNDPALKMNAMKELEEEAGRNGLPVYSVVDELVTYEDCGFIYKTFIIDISLEEKNKWNPQPELDCLWEVDDQEWFHKDEWQQQDIFFGFTPILINAIDGILR